MRRSGDVVATGDVCGGPVAAHRLRAPMGSAGALRVARTLAAGRLLPVFSIETHIQPNCTTRRVP